MGLIIYVSLLLLTHKILSLPFNPQDNAFLSWAHSYAAFHNQPNCWVCGLLPSSPVEGFLWWTSPLQGKDLLSYCGHWLLLSCGIGLLLNSGGVLRLLSHCKVPHLGVLCGVDVGTTCCLGAPNCFTWGCSILVVTGFS